MKLFEVWLDFHLLQTELTRKKQEVGSHERTLSRTSSLRASMGNSEANNKLTVSSSSSSSSSRDFLFPAENPMLLFWLKSAQIEENSQ